MNYLYQRHRKQIVEEAQKLALGVTATLSVCAQGHSPSSYDQDYYSVRIALAGQGNLAVLLDRGGCLSTRRPKEEGSASLSTAF